MNKLGVLLATTVLLSGIGLGAEVKVGDVAPPVTGKWFTADGKAPDLKGKVYLIDFWHAA